MMPLTLTFISSSISLSLVLFITLFLGTEHDQATCPRVLTKLPISGSLPSGPLLPKLIPKQIDLEHWDSSLML